MQGTSSSRRLHDGTGNDDLESDTKANAEVVATDEAAEQEIPMETVLRQLLENQRQQEAVLQNIRWKVGCLFYYLLLLPKLSLFRVL